MLLIKALNPGNSLSTGTRLSAILYPTIRRSSSLKTDLEAPRVAQNMMNIGVSCTEAVGRLSTLIDARVNAGVLANPYLPFIRSDYTYPAQAISLLNKKIKESNDDTRQRAVIIITDGASDEFSDDEPISQKKVTTRGQLDILLETDPDINILAVGFGNEGDPFEADLKTFTSNNLDNVIISRDPLDLADRLVKRLITLNIICEERGEEIRTVLSRTSNVDRYCNCTTARYVGGGGRYVNNCKAGGSQGKDRTEMEQKKDRAPVECDGEPSDESGVNNKWWVGSSKYRTESYDPVFPAIGQNENELEQEILTAVEEVLRKRMEN